MYSFSIITNNYEFLYEFAFRTDAYIRVADVPDDIGLCDRFELCYLELQQMLEAKDILNEILLEN